MEYFLHRIARHLHSGYGDDLRDHAMVFPNRRAGLFFLKYLSSEIKNPVWAPGVMTINDLFRSLSALRPAENEILLFELFKVYRAITGSKESFDDFYFWGDILINDFDDVDKYLADASRLFQNVSDLKKIDQQFGSLTREQIEIVRRFWINFNPERNTGLKEKFIGIWSVLGALYKEFGETLRKKNLAYEGMIFRDVAENPDFMNHPAFRWDKVHFVGFNALNECEKKLMLKVKEAEKALFYWDYDSTYIDEKGLNTAGYFLKDNLKMFGNDMPDDWNCNTNLSSDRSNIKCRVIETASDVAQVKLIPAILSEIPGIDPENAHNTAVVLADENLLLPVLSSLPDDLPDVNITMGYPLRQTPAYLLVSQLLSLQRNAITVNGKMLFSHEDVTALIKNELIAGLLDETDLKIPGNIMEHNMVLVPGELFSGSERLSAIFTKIATPKEMSDYIKNTLLMLVQDEDSVPANRLVANSVLNEFIYRIILSLNRLDALAGSPDVELKTETWSNLLDRILRMQSVPFSGEPLSGIQIMGILETRTLDFRNLVMLSVNEGIMPATTTSSSFIPFSLRQAFGLPSLNHQESIYAYHFYRLLHRAENITFIYNSNAEGVKSGEMSRFLQQMKYEPATAPDFKNLSFEISNPAAVGERIERTAVHNKLLLERFITGGRNRILSPSAINTWLNCRMRFYYQYVNGLSEPEEMITEIDPARLGSMVHSAIRSLYGEFIGKTIDLQDVRRFIDDRETLTWLANRSVNEVLRRENESFTLINEMMVKEVLLSYIVRILEIDRISAPFMIVSIEQPYSFPFRLNIENSEHDLRLGGKIDRVDIREGVTRIVDYKTGKIADSVAAISDLFRDDRDKEPDAWLQTLLYCEAYNREAGKVETRPSVYKVRKSSGSESYDMLILGGEALNDYYSVREEFLNGLSSLIKLIFSPSEPFIMTKMKNRKCSYCPFRVLCNR